VPAGFANGDSIARTARRMLDTLDGRCPWAPSALAQASECLNCAGWVTKADGGICHLCLGTGHNLAGVLPAGEHPDPRVSRLYASASRAMASAVAVASFDIPRAVALARAGGLTEPLAAPPLFGPFTAAGEARLHRVSVAVALPAEIGGSGG
jgi:hypothetical protein